uniref:Predicted protein n=1 Tax=Hordeum vulgare subsp. vulgare TaxID=112509 RepID=F2D235_HORVV|nr:predicted protein [Hordeum vulgare subsp. vulgare]
MHDMAGWTRTAVPASAAFLNTTVYGDSAFTVQRRPLPIRAVCLVPPSSRVHPTTSNTQHDDSIERVAPYST